MAPTVDLAGLKFDDFSPQLDTVFELRAHGGSIPLRLVKADPAGDSGRPGGAFSLLFVAPAGPFLPQSIYPLAHPAMGTMEVFLVPIGPTQGGNGYHAVFA
jgi:hypothetical protein